MKTKNDNKYQSLFQNFKHKLIHHSDDYEDYFNCGIIKIENDIYLNWFIFDVYILKDNFENNIKIY